MAQVNFGALAGLRPLSDGIGAEIHDVNAAHMDRVWPQVHQAFLDYHVLVFRDQSLDESQFQAIAERFGPIEGSYVMPRSDGKPSTPIHFIQNIDANGKIVANPYGNANFFWHTDKQYFERPSLLTMLQAIELPPVGGNTEFADMTAAYDALSAQMKERLEGLWAMYSYEYMVRICLNREATEEEKRKAPTREHPLVRTHPETGRKSLFLGSYCCGIVGMPKEEAISLIRDLTEHATSPRFVYVHRWQKGDVVMWDNRCLLHRAISNFDMSSHRRVLRRVVVQGDVPF